MRDRQAPRGGGKAPGKTERGSSRGASRSGGRSGERAAERGGARSADRAGGRSAERTGERGTGRSADRGGRSSDRSFTAERAGARRTATTDRGAGRSADRTPRAPSQSESSPERRESRGGGFAHGEASERHIWGVNPVLEALRAQSDQIERIVIAEGQVGTSAAAEILSRARDAGLRVDRLPRERLSTLSGGGVHQGVVAELRGFNYVELEELLASALSSDRPPLIVLLDGIQDPHNLGAIIRSAHALGAHGVVVTKDRAAAVTGSVVKASAGATAHTPIARVVNLSRTLETLKDAGLWIAAADPEGPEPLYRARLDGPLAVVVGAEGAGVRKGVLEHCDLRVSIPLLGQVDSLNASVSAGVLLYEVARQRALM